MAERMKGEIEKALEHVAASDHMLYGAYYTARSDGGESIKLLERVGFTESDLLTYTRVKLGGISSAEDKKTEDKLRKKLAKFCI